MARPTRGTVEAGLYHVWRRSTGPIPMYRDDFDRTDFCRRLALAITKYRWKCHSFCLMTTHYHLLLEVEQDFLQPGMHMLNGQYAQCFNRRWGRSGHLKAGQYKNRLIDGEHAFLRCVRYIALNPVEAGMCEHPADWPWSSYRGSAGSDAGFPFVTNELLLGVFHETREKAQRLLRLFVEAA